MTSHRLLLGLVAAALFLVPQLLSAQNQTTAEPASEAASEYRGPLPFYFGKLGLSDQQKEQCYDIQAQYAAQIEALQKQIEKLQDERDLQMEKHLTPGQTLRLKELREEARRCAAQQDSATRRRPRLRLRNRPAPA